MTEGIVDIFPRAPLPHYSRNQGDRDEHESEKVEIASRKQHPGSNNPEYQRDGHREYALEDSAEYHVKAVLPALLGRCFRVALNYHDRRPQRLCRLARSK